MNRPLSDPVPPTLLTDRESSGLLRLDEPLLWRPNTMLGSEFALIQGNATLGELGRPSSKASSAWGECLGEEWVIGASRNFWNTVRVDLRRPEAHVSALRFTGISLRRGVVVAEDGTEFRWYRPVIGRGQHILETSGGERVLEIRTVSGRWWGGDLRVTLEPRARARDDLRQLLLVSCYLRAMGANGLWQPFRVLRGDDPFRGWSTGAPM